MTFRRFFCHALARRLLLGLWTVLVLFSAPVHAQGITVQQASLEADSVGGWNLDARFDFELNSSLEDAINKGIPLYFTTSFELTRPRWYWFDESTSHVSQSIRLSFQPLTREYRISSGGSQLGGLKIGGVAFTFYSLQEALTLIKHVNSWHVIDSGQVQPGETYTASVRMQLDTALMPKPFQIDAVNNHDWNLSSDWKRFEFKVDDNAK